MVSDETRHWWWALKDGIITCSNEIDVIQREALYLAWKDELKKNKSNKEYMIGELLLEDIKSIKITKLQKRNGEQK